jgi:hypothetical protein
MWQVSTGTFIIAHYHCSGDKQRDCSLVD